MGTFMKMLTPSAGRICDNALIHFAQRGYDAASLSEIAEVCGMRKASLYTHFRSKDALFEAVFERALAAEHGHVAQCFGSGAAGLPGDTYLDRLEARYTGQPGLKFLLRTAFFPPAALHGLVTRGFEGYLACMRQAFCSQCESRASGADLEEMADAWLAIVDSLYIELIYGNAQVYGRRLKALRRLLAGDSRHGQ